MMLNIGCMFSYYHSLSFGLLKEVQKSVNTTMAEHFSFLLYKVDVTNDLAKTCLFMH